MPTQLYGNYGAAACNANYPSPAITFQVNLALHTKEVFGPITNSREMGMLHPDQYSTSPDRGRYLTNVRQNDIVTWLEGLMAGPNIELKNNVTGTPSTASPQQFTAYGQQAAYLLNTYVAPFNATASATLNSTVYTAAQQNALFGGTAVPSRAWLTVVANGTTVAKQVPNPVFGNTAATVNPVSSVTGLPVNDVQELSGN